MLFVSSQSDNIIIQIIDLDACFIIIRCKLVSLDRNSLGTSIRVGESYHYHCTKSHDMGNTNWCRVFTGLWVTNIILLYFLSCVVSCHK